MIGPIRRRGGGQPKPLSKIQRMCKLEKVKGSRKKTIQGGGRGGKAGPLTLKGGAGHNGPTGPFGLP